MIKCEVIKVLQNNGYVLRCKDKTYEQTLEFYGVDNPKVGDKIALQTDLLDINSQFYTQPYAFEFQKNINIDDIDEKELKDCAILKSNNKIYLLKRIYG